MKTLKIGIAGYDRMKARTVAIARGEHTPASGDPTVWFTSIESFYGELCEGALATQSRASGDDCPGEAGLAHRAGGACRAKQVEPVADVEDDGALRAGGAEEGVARYAGSAGPVRSSQPRRFVDFDFPPGCENPEKPAGNGENR